MPQNIGHDIFNPIKADGDRQKYGSFTLFYQLWKNERDAFGVLTVFFHKRCGGSTHSCLSALKLIEREFARQPQRPLSSSPYYFGQRKHCSRFGQATFPMATGPAPVFAAVALAFSGAVCCGPRYTVSRSTADRARWCGVFARVGSLLRQCRYRRWLLDVRASRPKARFSRGGGFFAWLWGL